MMWLVEFCRQRLADLSIGVEHPTPSGIEDALNSKPLIWRQYRFPLTYHGFPASSRTSSLLIELRV